MRHTILAILFTSLFAAPLLTVGCGDDPVTPVSPPPPPGDGKTLAENDGNNTPADDETETAEGTEVQEDPLKDATKRPGPVRPDLFNNPVAEGKKVELKRGGTLTMAVLAFSRTWEPDYDNATVVSEVVDQYINEAMITSDNETWDNMPLLAEAWDIDDLIILKKDNERLIGKVKKTDEGVSIQVRPDPKTPEYDNARTYKSDEIKEVRLGCVFTWYIRKGVKFHNGMELTSKDVDWTIRLLKSENNVMPSIQSYLAKISDVDVLGEHKIRFIYNEQYFLALTVCGGYWRVRPWKYWDPEGLLWKDDKAYFAKYEEMEQLVHPIGTGPYKFKSFKRDYSVTLERNEDYWDKKFPQGPDEIVFRAINDPVAQLKALEAGEVDYCVQLTPPTWLDFFKEAENKENFGQVRIVYTAYYYIGWNCTTQIFKEKKVRQAMSYGAADIKKIIKENLHGLAVRVTGANYQYGPGHNPDLNPIEYDPDKAIDLLEEVGWYDSDGDGIIDKDGTPFEFTLLTRTRPETSPASQRNEIIRQNLKKLGIKMSIRKVEWGTLLQLVEKGEFDAVGLGWGLSSPPYPNDMFQIWHSSQIGDKGSNHINYRNKRLDELLEARRVELDPKKGQKMVWEMEKIIFDDQPYLFLYMPAELQAYNKKWRGVKFYVPRPGRILNEWHLFDIVDQ